MEAIIRQKTTADGTDWDAASVEYFAWRKREESKRFELLAEARNTANASDPSSMQFPTSSPKRQHSATQEPAQNYTTGNHQTCASYGFKMGSTAFGQCLMQLNQTQQQAQLQQQQYQLQLQQYQQQQAAYEAQQEAIKKEKDRRKWAAIGMFGFGMAASNSPTFAGGMADGLRAMNGQPPLPPPTPPPSQPLMRD